MVFGQRLVEGMVTNEITEPRIVENTQVFTRDCINPEFLDNLAMLNKLTKAKNAWKFINGTDGGGFSANRGESQVTPIM